MKKENKVLNYAYLLLKIRPRSEAEIIQRLQGYLKKHGIENSESIINDVLKILKESKLIDDVSFTRFWIESRFRGKSKGKIVITSELIQKGIDKELIEKEITDLQREYPEDEAIAKLVNKAQGKYRNITGFEKKQKIIAYVVRRGFDYDKTRRVIDEMGKKT